MEEISEGEKIREFRITAKTDRGERELLHAHCIGHKRLIRTADLRAREIRLDILQSEGKPVIRDFTVYGCTPFLERGQNCEKEKRSSQSNYAEKAALRSLYERTL